MNQHSFKVLCDLIQKDVQVDEEMSRVQTGKEAIIPEIALHCTIRYLAMDRCMIFVSLLALAFLPFIEWFTR